MKVVGAPNNIELQSQRSLSTKKIAKLFLAAAGVVIILILAEGVFSKKGMSDCCGKVRLGDSKIGLIFRYDVSAGSTPGEYLMASPCDQTEQYHLRFGRDFLLQRLEKLHIEFPEEMDQDSVRSRLACFGIKIPENAGSRLRISGEKEGIRFFSDSVGEDRNFQYLQIAKPGLD